MAYDPALVTSLVCAILDVPKYKPHPEIPDDWECAYCLAPLRADGTCNHTPNCLVTKAWAVFESDRKVSEKAIDPGAHLSDNAETGPSLTHE